MRNACVIGIDQGTSSTKALVLDQSGKELAQFSIPVKTDFVTELRVEQDPEELFGSVLNMLQSGRAFAASHRLKPVGIGLTYQRSGVCAWERDSQTVLHPLMTWRDRSTKPVLDRIGSKLERVRTKSTLTPLPDYAGGKFSKLQAEFPSKTALVGTLDTYILSRISNGAVFVTDDSMAARTMLYDLERCVWDEELCALFQVEIERLAKVAPSIAVHAEIDGLPIVASLGDQQAALLGTLTHERDCILNLGSVASLCIATGDRPLRLHGFPGSVLFSRSENDGGKVYQFLIEGISNASGSVVRAVTESMRLAAGVKEIDKLCQQSATEAGPVGFFPIGGTASPDWRYDLPCLVKGWDGKDKRMLVPAMMENIGNFILENIKLLKAQKVLSEDLVELKTAGGLSELDYLLQYLADCSGIMFLRLSSPEATARGAALSALLGLGYIKSHFEFNQPGILARFVPKNPARVKRFERWRELKQGCFRGDHRGAELFKL